MPVFKLVTGVKISIKEGVGSHTSVTTGASTFSVRLVGQSVLSSRLGYRGWNQLLFVSQTWYILIIPFLQVWAGSSKHKGSIWSSLNKETDGHADLSQAISCQTANPKVVYRFSYSLCWTISVSDWLTSGKYAVSSRQSYKLLSGVGGSGRGSWPWYLHAPLHHCSFNKEEKLE